MSNQGAGLALVIAVVCACASPPGAARSVRLGAASIDGGGMRLGPVAMSLAGIGRDGPLRTTSTARPVRVGAEVRAERAPGVVEWYRSLGSGLEHGVTLEERPQGDGPLTLALRLHGDVKARSTDDPDVLALASGARELARYSHLVVLDADGRRLPARMAPGAGGIRIEVDDRAARYPVVVDPLLVLRLEAELPIPGTMRDGAAALSRDGSRAVVATGEEASVGAFVRTGSTWAPEPLPVPAIATRTYGASVAISADGSTVIVGWPEYDDVAGGEVIGRVDVFSRTGSGWVPSGTLLSLLPTSAPYGAHCGRSVAVSGDGTVVVVGCEALMGESGGHAVLFRYSAPFWNAERDLAALAGSHPDFGRSVAVSEDGARFVVGAANAVHVLSTFSSVAVLTSASAGGVGGRIAIDANATRIVSTTSTGAIVSFVEGAGSWSSELVPGASGDGVALSGDATRLAVAGTGSVRLFLRGPSGWADSGAAVTDPNAGVPVAFSGDGNHLLAAHGINATAAFAVSPALATGVACGGAAECTTGFCVDGVCCDAACDGGASDCRACLGALTGLTDGTCAPRVAGAVCNPSAGVCDPAEVCDGTDTACPAPARHPAGFVCNASRGDCDPAEVCDGTSPTCPGDVLLPDRAACGGTTLSCSSAGMCDGVSPVCAGSMGFRPRGVICGPADPLNPCDANDVCDGMGVCVTGNAPASTPCGLPPAGPCDAPDHCDGSLPVCLDALLVDVECRGSAGGCDPAELCSGASISCPPDLVSPAGTVCRAAPAACDTEESCDGASGTCPMDVTACVADVGVGTDAPGADAGPPPAPTAGCSCRAGGAPSHTLLAGLLVALAVVRRRTRQGTAGQPSIRSSTPPAS